MTRRQRSKPNDAVTQERRLQALDLRKAGASFRAIGAQLNISHEQARTDVMQSLQELAHEQREKTQEYRQLELERLDRMLMAIWTQAAKGDLQAVDRALKISDRRAKLLGLDAPVKQELTGADGTPLESVITIAAVDYRQALKPLAPDDDGSDIAAQDFCFIRPKDTAVTLWRETLFPMGLKLFAKVLSDLDRGVLVAIPQDNSIATWEPSIDRPPLYRPDLPMLGAAPEGFTIVKHAGLYEASGV